MRIVLFGTGPFAVPSFESILQSHHEVLALVTRPISDSGKRRKTAENPSRDLGEQLGLAILEPTDVNAPSFVEELQKLNAELFVVCDYGQILSRDCLSAAQKGGINLHGSLLPKYRGAAPINWAIYHGEKTTGVTIIHMTARLDGGPCLATASLDIAPEETTVQIEPQLAQLGVEPVHQAIKMLESWDGVSSIGTQQDPRLATKAPRLKKSDGIIDWSREASQIVNQIRAFLPWPGTYTFCRGETNLEPDRLIIHRAQVVDPNDCITGQFNDQLGLVRSDLAPGQVVFCNSASLWIKTGLGLLSLIDVQPSGKKMMAIAEFLRGHRIAVGHSFH